MCVCLLGEPASQGHIWLVVWTPSDVTARECGGGGGGGGGGSEGG